MRNRRLLALALVCASLLALPAAASAAVPISVFVVTGFECVDGTGPANKEVIATLRTPGGHVRGRFRTVTDGDGSWFGCFPAGVNGNDRLRLNIGNQSRLIRIPRLEPEIDRVDNTISGWARPHSVVFAEIVHAKTFRKTTSHTLAVQADAEGRYVFDTTGEVNLRGGDSVTVFGPDGDDTFGALVIAPHVNILHANNVMTGTANNGTDLVFVLTDRNGNIKADVTAGTSQLFFGISLFVVNMFKDSGAAAYPVNGDVLASSLADDAVLEIPNGSVTGNPATDVVTGHCMRNAPFMLIVDSEIFYGRTNSSGNLTRDVGNRLNLRRGDPLQLMCMYKSGDTWARTNIAR